jgi:hypothetical protein
VVKFKTTAQTLTEEQSTWIKSASKRVAELLKETPPLGPKFAASVKHILEREEIWNKWKNEGCQNFVKEKRPAPPVTPNLKVKKAKPLTSDFIAQQSGKGFLSENTDVISKLCNVNHGNLEACKEADRHFLPTLREFFIEAIEQLDPVNQVERQYALVQQTDWCWKALRLLAKRSAFYFMQNQNVKTIPEYIEAICNKLGKEFNTVEKLQQQQQQQNQLQQQQAQKVTHLAVKEMPQLRQQDESDSCPGSPAINANTIDTNENELNNIEAENENSVQDNDSVNGLDNEEHNNSVGGEPTTAKAAVVVAAVEAATNAVVPMDTDGGNNMETVIQRIEQDQKINKAKNFFDSDLINFISEDLIHESQEWKDIVLHLKLSQEKIDSVESETSDLKEQARRIFQFWTEQDERNDLPSVFLDALKQLEKSELAQKFEAKINE